MTISKTAQPVSFSQHIRILESKFANIITDDYDIICVKISGAHILNYLREGVGPNSTRLKILYKNVLRDIVNSTFIKEILVGYYYNSKMFIFLKVLRDTKLRVDFIASRFTSKVAGSMSLQGIELFKDIPLYETTVFTLHNDQLIDYVHLRTSYCARDSISKFIVRQLDNTGEDTTQIKQFVNSVSFNQIAMYYPELHQQWENQVDVEQRYGVYYFKNTQSFFNFEHYSGKHHIKEIMADHFYNV